MINKIKKILRKPWIIKDKIKNRSYQKKYDELFRSLKNSFDEFCYLEDQDLRIIAKKLVDQEGIIDPEIEGLENTENQRDLSLKFTWGHNHNFGNDFSVIGRMGNRHVALIAEFMTGFGLERNFFKNKNCIDVGCWTGGTTLMLKHLGAHEVVALEEVKKYGKTAIALCNSVYGLKGISSEAKNLYVFNSGKKYDIAYFPGVIYHLSDPVLGLRRLYNGLADGGVCLVETDGIRSDKSIAEYHGNRVYHENSGESAELLNRGGWNWFIPSPLCLKNWMIEAGFNEVKTYYSLTSNRVYGYGVRRGFTEICKAGLSVYDIR